MQNMEIRQEIQKSRVKNWEIAEHLHISESHFSRKLRRELPDDEKAKIRAAISELKAGESNA